jgi:hypothetical protein
MIIGATAAAPVENRNWRRFRLLGGVGMGIVLQDARQRQA